MLEYNQLLTNILICLELFFAVIFILGLCYLSKVVQDLEKMIKEQAGNIVEGIVQVRQEVHTLEKYLGFVRGFKKFNHAKKMAISVVDIINILLLLAPGTAFRKIQKHISMQILKSVVSKSCS